VKPRRPSRQDILSETAQHRKLGIDLFNYVWTLLEKPDRTREESEGMIHAAHASRWHWSVVGAPVNFARGEWQISRVYAVLGRGESALVHALRCLEICRANEIGDFDLAYAYEALARAWSVLGKCAGDPPVSGSWRGRRPRISRKRTTRNCCSEALALAAAASSGAAAANRDRRRKSRAGRQPRTRA